MILADKDIKKSLKSGELYISPLKDEQIQPASVDLRIGRSFSKPVKTRSITTFDEDVPCYDCTQDTIVIDPGEFILATTMETIHIPKDISAFVEGRSSIGRMGLFTENAGWIDPGFRGEITLELYNASPNKILIEAGRRVCQLVFARTESPADNPYNGKYLGQKGATPSKIRQDMV